MSHDSDEAFAGALVLVRAIRDLMNDAVADGAVARTMAITIQRGAEAAAEDLRNFIVQRTSRLGHDWLRAVQASVVDIEMLGELSALAADPTLTANNARHVANALRYTAGRAVEGLQNLGAVIDGG